MRNHCHATEERAAPGQAGDCVVARLAALLFWLLLIGWLADGGGKAKAGDAANSPPLDGVVTGYGVTVEKAQADAIQKALDLLEGALRKHDPPLLTWKPDESFIRRRLIQEPGHLGDDTTLPEVGLTKTWIYPLSAPSWQTLRHFEQTAQLEQRARQRKAWGGLAAGGMLVMALLTLGALKLAATGRKARSAASPPVAHAPGSPIL